MLFAALANVINLISQLLILLIFIYALISWFVSPYHPIREAIGRIIDPLLDPIRRVVPTAGGFDFSPLILMVLVEIIARILINILLAI